MNKVYVLPAGESWIVDRFVDEWTADNADITVPEPDEADVVWLLADWAWQRPAHRGALVGRKVLTTVHHIVPGKFGPAAHAEFRARDAATTAYHVYNSRTFEFIRPLTHLPIHFIPYWANQRIWRQTGERAWLRQRYGLPQDAYIVGSFQRDTEGNDLESPKLEKGPDLLADAIIRMRRMRNDLHVLLAGWRRQYVISRLRSAGVPFTYFERPPHEVVNDLYQVLDLYPVTARYEGGPQALIECGLLGVPVVSRPVGIAEQVLPPSAINDDVCVARACVPDVSHMLLPRGYVPYRELLETL